MSVLIIGNGFDLNLGFETGYKHFIESEQFKNLLPQNEIAKQLKNNHELHNWIDIENEFQKYSDNFNANISRGIHASELPKREKVKEWHSKIVKALIDYLNTIDYTKYERNSEAFKLLQKLASDTINPDFFPNPLVLNIFDFNYTPSVSLILKELGYGSKIRHVKVHGSLEDSNIVFGVSDDCDIYTEHNFLRKSATKNYPAADFTGMRGKIHIFGHSLGNMDYDYFKDFFTKVVYPGLNFGDSEFNIYYYKGDNDRDAINDRLFDLTDKRLAVFKKNIRFNEIECQ
jgi:hypothetical protein